MPELLDQSEEFAAEPASTPSVLDVGMFDKAQRSVQYLQYAGLLTDDKDVTTLNLLKRVNHAAFADEHDGSIQSLQSRFHAVMESGDIQALTEGGVESTVSKLVDGYLAARVAQNKKIVAELDALPSSLDPAEFNAARHRAEANARKYEAERAYYQASPELLNEAVRAHPEALQGGYLPIGKLAVVTGIVKGDKEAAADMVDDVLANAAAHGMLHMAEAVMTTEDDDLKRNRKYSDHYASNIIAKANDTAAGTVSISRVSPVIDATPELARIQALNSLLSAQLHEMTKHTVTPDGNSEPSPEVLAANLIAAKKLVTEYQSATMSLAYSFLGSGPGRNDPRMQQLRQHLASMMEQNNIALQMDRPQAEASANRLVEESAAFLRERSAGNPHAQNNIDALVKLATPPRTMVDRLLARAGEAVSSWVR